MASVRTTVVAAILFCFSYSVLTGCAQQYEYDYSAEARVANWQPSKTSRTRSGDTPSRLDVKNSSPDTTIKNRPRTQSRYEEASAKAQYETTRQYGEEQSERAPTRQRQRPRQRTQDIGRRTVERRVDEPKNVETISEITTRRKTNRQRVTESTTQDAPQSFTPRLRVPMEDTLVNVPKGFSLPNPSRRQRVREEISTTESSVISTPRPFSRGRVKAKIHETAKKSENSDEISESDNYPPGFIERIKNNKNQTPQEDAAPRRSRLRQRAAKTYPSIAISEANRFRQRYPRLSTTTEKPTETQIHTTEPTNEVSPARRNPTLEARQRSRSRYTTPRSINATKDYTPRPYRGYGRRFSTEKNENSTQGSVTTLSPREKYLSRLRSINRQLKVRDKVVEEIKSEALLPAENVFYMHQDDVEKEPDMKQNMKNLDVDLHGDASEENATVDITSATMRMVTTSISTTLSTPAATSSPTEKQTSGVPLPSTRHRFSSRFSRSNKTTTDFLVTSSTTSSPESESLVLDNPNPSPINLTSLFDGAPDSTLSITALFNNSLTASSSVATNKMNSSQTLTTTNSTTTARPSTITEISSTNSPTPTNTTTKRTSTKKKTPKKSKKSSKTTTVSPLNDRPILRNLASLFGNTETTTRRSSGKKKSSRARTTTTTTAAATPGPAEIARIQNIINDTMELINNRTIMPTQVHAVPRLALNALTPETSLEETSTQPATMAATTISSTTTTTTTSSTTTTSTTTTTAATTTTTATATSSTTPNITAGELRNNQKKNCTSQFVYFDYNSTAPIPKQFATFQESGKRATTPSTTTSTTADYFVYGVYPNNTVVRKRAFKAFDYEKYHSPYVIFGIYPNNTIVKKFPNGTIINDEFMTSDNEIRDIMGIGRRPTTLPATARTTTTTKKSEKTTTTTTKKPETTTTTKKPETTTKGMKMEGSQTTENIVIEGVTTTESDNPDDMFEIFENEIEREERRDEEISEVTTEIPSTTTVSDDDSFLFEARLQSTPPTPTTTDSNVETTTEKLSKFLESDIETSTQGVSTTETTESLPTTTFKSSREGKSFSFNDMLSNKLVETTDRTTTTTESTPTETTEQDFFARIFEALESSTTTEGTPSTTESTDRTTITDFDLQQIFQPTTTRYDSSRSLDIDIRDGPVYRPSTTEAVFETTTRSPTEDTRFVSTTTEASTTTQSSAEASRANLVESTTTEASTESKGLFGLSEGSLFGSFTESTPTESSSPKSILGQFEGNIFESFVESTTTEASVDSESPSDLSLGSTTEPTTTEAPVNDDLRSLFELYGGDLFGSTTAESPKSGSLEALFNSGSTTTESPTTFSSFPSESELFTSTTERRNPEETTTVSNIENEVFPLNGDLFQVPDNGRSSTKSTITEDEPPGLVNLAYRALGSSDTITPVSITTTTPKYITSTMKSTNYREKKIKMKMKKTSTSTPKTENVFIVTPETTALDSYSDFAKKGKVKFVTLTPGVIVTTDVRDENDVMTMSSQHVQKVTKAPANIPDNFLTSVVGEIQEKSSSPIPDILRNVEKELQGNGISVSLARRIIEMAIERAVTTETPQEIGRLRETTMTTPYITTTTPYITTTTASPTQRTTIAYTTPTPTTFRTESTTANEISTTYNDLFSTVNVNPLSVGFIGDYTETTTKDLRKEKSQTTTTRTTTTTTAKPRPKTKSSRNSAAAMSTLSENDKLLLEAILKQQNSNLSVQELDKIIENQIRLAEEVRKAGKNMKKKPRVTTTTTTTTQTPPLFGFLISLFSGNSSPSNIPVTRAPVKQTRSRLKSSRGPGSMTNTHKSIKPDPLKEAEEGSQSGDRSTRGELVTAAIDVTKAVSKFMGTFLSSAAQSFQAFFSNFGRGR